MEDWDRTELPPRTRRIRPRRPSRPHRDGTTSAHAENTAVRHHGCGSNGNYLRARGEYVGAGARLRPRWELPPRTRRIRAAATSSSRFVGTTSAHAENTTDHGLPRRGERNYLRARGEYRPVGQHERSASELPPRTRRIHPVAVPGGVLGGTTSAHAENTQRGKPG